MLTNAPAILHYLINITVFLKTSTFKLSYKKYRAIKHDFTNGKKRKIFKIRINSA